MHIDINKYLCCLIFKISKKLGIFLKNANVNSNEYLLMLIVTKENFKKSGNKYII